MRNRKQQYNAHVLDAQTPTYRLKTNVTTSTAKPATSNVSLRGESQQLHHPWSTQQHSHGPKQTCMWHTHKFRVMLHTMQSLQLQFTKLINNNCAIWKPTSTNNKMNGNAQQNPKTCSKLVRARSGTHLWKIVTEMCEIVI